MLTAETKIEWNGRPLQELDRLLQLRQKMLGENAADAVVATAIDVVRSLRTLTRKAPARANRKSFIVEETPYVASWERKGWSFRRVARVSGTGAKAPIYPVNNAGQHYVQGEHVRVWKITPAHGDRMKWDRNRNKGCWYVFAQSSAVARRFAQEHVSRMLRKESGMGKTALGFAMARLSTRSEPIEAKGPKAQQVASRAISITSSGAGGQFALTVRDDLDYAQDALRGGASAIDLAMAKAANKIAGRLAKWQETHLLSGDRISTPFPEIIRRRR
ncbi:MAG: hypothetical protein J6V72_14915 [Kiritimatiellae bacterium]|nr:hypothetical protein [Kiritimatiellia bacterium]